MAQGNTTIPASFMKTKTNLSILIVLAVVLGSGCSGINVQKSVSPLDFILPGLMYNTPATPPVPSLANDAPLLAGTPIR